MTELGSLASEQAARDSRITAGQSLTRGSTTYVGRADPIHVDQVRPTEVSGA
jgi:hypothetical protein